MMKCINVCVRLIIINNSKEYNYGISCGEQISSKYIMTYTHKQATCVRLSSVADWWDSEVIDKDEKHPFGQACPHCITAVMAN